MTPLTRLLALDIDGTLLPPRGGHNALPHDDIVQVIGELAAAGVVVVLASGRMYPGTARIAQHLGLHGPLICQQGASVHEFDGSIRHRCAIDVDIAHELVAYARAGGWPFAWFDSTRYLASAPNAASSEFAAVSGIEPEYHVDPQRSGVAPTGIDIISSTTHASEVHRELAARYGERVHLLDFPGVTAAHDPAASKGNAMAQMAAELGIAQAETMAIGDSVNDASMLRWAGRGITLPHCDRYARAAADEVLGGQGIDGLVPLLRSVLQAHLRA